MSYLDWHAGMKVVCIKRSSWRVVAGESEGRSGGPMYGEICLITLIDVSPSDRQVYLRIAGYDEFDRYLARNFRPVQNKKTDISIFTAMLTGAKQTEPA